MRICSKRSCFCFIFTLFFFFSQACANNVNRQIIRDKLDACWNGDVELQGHNSMQKECKAVGGVLIRTSNTELNCNGAVIDLKRSAHTGIEINSDGTPLENVVIKNCEIRNSKFQGIYIGWKQSDREKSNALTHDQQYSLTPKKIYIVNTRIMNPGSSGIYVDDYVQDVIFDRIVIDNPPAMAIYFEFSSRNNVLKNSTITGAGKLAKREAISIDSSSGNLLEGNTLTDNPYGGIFIYRNCSEHFYSSDNQVIRWMPASNNIIENNQIRGSRVGVWIASRQSQQLQNTECGNGYYAEGKYSLDDAQHNLVLRNKIRDADIGVIVEDDNNQIIENEFEAISKIGIRVGTPIRSKYLDRPVINTRIFGNQSSSITPVLRYMWGSKAENSDQP